MELNAAQTFATLAGLFDPQKAQKDALDIATAKDDADYKKMRNRVEYLNLQTILKDQGQNATANAASLLAGQNLFNSQYGPNAAAQPGPTPGGAPSPQPGMMPPASPNAASPGPVGPAMPGAAPPVNAAAAIMPSSPPAQPDMNQQNFMQNYLKTGSVTGVPPNAAAVSPPSAPTANAATTIAPLKGSDYDMAGYIAKYGQPDQSKGQHLTDEFKMPSHISFSNESKYSKPGQEGGEWKKEADGKWHFYASPFNLTQHTPQEMQAEFDRINAKDKANGLPESVLHLPAESKNAAARMVKTSVGEIPMEEIEKNPQLKQWVYQDLSKQNAMAEQQHQEMIKQATQLTLGLVNKGLTENNQDDLDKAKRILEASPELKAAFQKTPHWDLLNNYKVGQGGDPHKTSGYFSHEDIVKEAQRPNSPFTVDDPEGYYKIDVTSPSGASIHDLEKTKIKSREPMKMSDADLADLGTPTAKAMLERRQGAKQKEPTSLYADEALLLQKVALGTATPADKLKLAAIKQVRKENLDESKQKVQFSVNVHEAAKERGDEKKSAKAAAPFDPATQHKVDVWVEALGNGRATTQQVNAFIQRFGGGENSAKVRLAIGTQALEKGIDLEAVDLNFKAKASSTAIQRVQLAKTVVPIADEIIALSKKIPKGIGFVPADEFTRKLGRYLNSQELIQLEFDKNKMVEEFERMLTGSQMADSRVQRNLELIRTGYDPQAIAFLAQETKKISNMSTKAVTSDMYNVKPGGPSGSSTGGAKSDPLGLR